MKFYLSSYSFRICKFVTNNTPSYGRISNCWIEASASSSSSSSSSLFFRRSSSGSTFHSALVTLNLSQKPDFSPKDLRNAYFTAAKLCHPDSLQKQEDGENVDFVQRFLDLTEAYELLQKHKYPFTLNSDGDDDENINVYNNVIHRSEEQDFREACIMYLGIDAETVEESKKCVLFREWLKGRTDAAFHWNNFFMLHGGLAPMLRQKKKLALTDGGGGGNNSDNIYGKRRRRRNGR